MKLKCSKCESNAVQILLGADDSRFEMCLGCGTVNQVRRTRAEPEEDGRPLALSRSATAPPEEKVHWTEPLFAARR
jgi:hypothetical protein